METEGLPNTEPVPAAEPEERLATLVDFTFKHSAGRFQALVRRWQGNQLDRTAA
jgi:hypothetical protein